LFLALSIFFGIFQIRVSAIHYINLHSPQKGGENMMLPSGPEFLIMLFMGFIPFLIGIGIVIFLITLILRLVKAVERIADQMEKNN
jgi:hypothetical protein